MTRLGDWRYRRAMATLERLAPPRWLAMAWVNRFPDGRYGVVQHADSEDSVWALGAVTAAYLAGTLERVDPLEAARIRETLGGVPESTASSPLGYWPVRSPFMAYFTGEGKTVVSEGYEYARLWMPTEETLYLRRQGITAGDSAALSVLRRWGIREDDSGAHAIVKGLELRGEAEVLAYLPVDYATRVDPLHIINVPGITTTLYQSDMAIALARSLLGAIGLSQTTSEMGHVGFPRAARKAVVDAALAWSAPERNALVVGVRELASQYKVGMDDFI